MIIDCSKFCDRYAINGEKACKTCEGPYEGHVSKKGKSFGHTLTADEIKAEYRKMIQKKGDKTE